MESSIAQGKSKLGQYSPIAVYYEDADSLEYVSIDVPSVYRRIDEVLTLVLSMDRRDPIGFRIKGFKNFYLRHVKPKYQSEDEKFLTLVKLVEEALSLAGDAVFKEEKRLLAYENARSMAGNLVDSNIFSEVRKIR